MTADQPLKTAHLFLEASYPSGSEKSCNDSGLSGEDELLMSEGRHKIFNNWHMEDF
jgi:hypothetical protein